MIKIIASTAVALMLGSAALVAPAAAASVSINVGKDHGYHGNRHVERRRVVRNQRCSTKTVITHRHGERIVRKVRTCH